MSGLHAALSPSAASRWCNCTPSGRLNQKYRDLFGDKSSEYAEEGTLAHSVAELKLRHENGELNDFNFKEQLKALGDIPSEMDRATDDYVDVVLTELFAARKIDPSAQLYIEQRLDMSEWVPECFGTSDAMIVFEGGLVVLDYKHGRGVLVSAVENYQARLYALGAYAAVRDLYDIRQVKEVIIQPRLDSITEEILQIEDLLCWANEVIKPAAQLAWKGEGEFHSGDWCRFCNVKAICRENVLTSLKVLENMFDSPDVISDDRINDMLPYLDQAEDWIKNVKAYVYSRAMDGERWRGYKLVRGKRPGRVWRNEEEVINQLSRAGYTEEQYFTAPKLKSVAELEKTLKKSAFDALVGKFVFQGEGSLALVPESDKREEYSPAKLSFGDLVEDSADIDNVNNSKQDD